MEFGFDLVEAAKWFWVALVAPVFGWLGGIGGGRRAAKRRKKARIAFLSGYPPEVKAELVDFYVERAHTRRGDPSRSAMEVLIGDGIVKAGPGAGPYAAVNRYLSIRADFWEVMDDWVASDIAAMRIYCEMLESASE